MKVNLDYYRINKYGVTLKYLADYETEKKVHALTGKKTVSTLDLAMLADLTGVKPKEIINPN